MQLSPSAILKEVSLIELREVSNTSGRVSPTSKSEAKDDVDTDTDDKSDETKGSIWLGDDIDPEKAEWLSLDGFGVGTGLKGLSLMMVFLVLIDFAIAVILAMVLNYSSCNKVSGCDIIEKNSTQTVNFFKSALLSCAIGVGLSCLRLMIVNYTNKTVSSAYTFIAYLAWAMCAVTFTYTDITSASPAAGQTGKRMVTPSA